MQNSLSAGRPKHNYHGPPEACAALVEYFAASAASILLISYRAIPARSAFNYVPLLEFRCHLEKRKERWLQLFGLLPE